MKKLDIDKNKIDTILRYWFVCGCVRREDIDFGLMISNITGLKYELKSMFKSMSSNLLVTDFIKTDVDENLDTLYYISDRWTTPERIKYLLDLSFSWEVKYGF